MGLTISHLNVRRSTLIEAQPARVWQEFESFERIRSWLGLGHTLHAFEPKTGGPVEFSVDIGGDVRRFGGSVLVWEPPRELSMEINWRPPHAWPVPMLWTIRLDPLYDGTHVQIVHHGFERLGATAAENLEGYEEGWDVKHLKALRSIVTR